MLRCVNEPKEEWIDLWKSGFCYYPFYALVYSGPRASFSPEDFQRAEEGMVEVFDRYLQDYSLTKPNLDFQKELYNVCSKIPGVCGLALKDVCSRYTRAQIEDSPELRKFCGCYAPPLIGETGKLLIRQGRYDYPCDPLCSRVDTIKRGTNGELDLCIGDICVINDISLKIKNSHLPYVSFNQVCTCKGRCRCIFDSSNIGKLLSDLNLNYTVRQFCPGEATCLETKDGVSTPVPCVASPISFSIPASFYISLALVVVVLIILGVVYFFFSKQR